MTLYLFLARLAGPTGRASLLALGYCVAAAPSGLAAQAPPPAIDPRMFDLDIPPGPVSCPPDARVATQDTQGNAVVARVQATVGQQQIVLLPDGQLVPRATDNAQPTGLPFQALDGERFVQQLLAEPALAGFKTKVTRRYVYIYNARDNFVLATSRILETMLPGVLAYCDGLGLAVRPPEFPLAAVVFRTEEEFQRYRVTQPGASAYYHVLTNHIVLHEQPRLAQLDAEMALQQTISTIAHEGAHQILQNIGAQQRLAVWPHWLSEGLAEFFSPTSTDSRSRWKGVGQINDLRMFELQRYLKTRGEQRGRGELLRQTVGGARLTSSGYASAWGLVHFLAKKRRPQFSQYVRQLSGLAPLQGDVRAAADGVVPGNLKIFQQHFGDDLALLEQEWLQYMRQLPYRDPFARWPHYVVMLSYGGGPQLRREADLFPLPQMAEQWRRDRQRQATEAGGANPQTSIRQFPDRAAAEQFLRQWLRGR